MTMFTVSSVLLCSSSSYSFFEMSLPMIVCSYFSMMVFLLMGLS
jgi:hypothetical protein